MSDIAEIDAELVENAENRYDNFSITEIDSIQTISEDSYLEEPIWVGGDKKFACLFIDLDHSSKMSFRKHPTTMAKIYDYFTQSLIDVLSEESIHADYIDIKGDGAFGIFEGEDAVFRALSAAITFSTFFKKHVRPKFQEEDQPINFKGAIHLDKILVKRIGKRGARNNNEVWAGRLVNKAAKLSTVTSDIYKSQTVYTNDKFGLVVASEAVFEILKTKEDVAVISCGHNMAGVECPIGQLWEEFDTSNVEDLSEEIVYYAPAIWCDECCDRVNAEILS